MIMDSFASLALATEEPPDRILDRPPFPKKAGIITVTMWRFIVMHSFYQFVVLAILLFFGAGTPVEKGGVFDFYSGIDADANETCHDRMLACQGNDPHNRSIEFELGTDECPTEQQCSAHFGVIFTAFVLMQLFNQINVR